MENIKKYYKLLDQTDQKLQPWSKLLNHDDYNDLINQVASLLLDQK